MPKVLFFSTNPSGVPALDAADEERKIADVLDDSPLHFRAVPAARFEDLPRKLLGERPFLVHFAGHGAQIADSEGDGAGSRGSLKRPGTGSGPGKATGAGDKGGVLVWRDDDGGRVDIDTARLEEVFKALEGVSCLVLNACFSEDHAHRLVKLVDCVIFTTGPILDRDAITFSTELYRALARNESIKTAFDFAMLSLSARPGERRILELCTRDGKDAREIFPVPRATAATALRELFNALGAEPPITERFAEVVIKARARDPRDGQLERFAERFSLVLSPRNELPPGGVDARQIDTGRLLDNAALCAADRLAQCASVQAIGPLCALLLRLPQPIASRVLAAMGAPALAAIDAGRWTRAIVDECGAQPGGLELLAAVIVAREGETPATRALDEELTRSLPRPAGELALIEKIRRARAAAATDEAVRAAFAEIAPRDLAARLGEVEAAVRCAWAVRALANLRPGSDGKLPVDRFVERLTTPVAPAQAAAPAAQGRYYLFISLLRRDVKEPLYALAACAMKCSPALAGDAPTIEWSDRMAAGEEKGPLEQQSAKLREFVSTAYDWLLDEQPDAVDNLEVELVLPREMLCVAIDSSWRIAIGGGRYGLATQYPVVLRSGERLSDPIFWRNTWALWNKRWSEHREQPRFDWIEPDDAEDYDRADALAARLDEDGATCAAMSAPRKNDTPSWDLDPLAKCIDLGLPVVVWLRDINAPMDAKGLLEPELHPGVWLHLPEWARTKRKSALPVKGQAAGAAPPIGKCLAVLSDDPTRIPPDLRVERKTTKKTTKDV